MANKPVKEIRYGRIKATIWANQTKVGVRHSVKLSRIYKDGQHWSTTDSFGIHDLPSVAAAAVSADKWILEHTRELAERLEPYSPKCPPELKMDM